MSYALGVDIGTSFVTTAIARPGSDDAETPAVQTGVRFSSALFVDAGSGIHLGEAAERRGSAAPARVIRGIIGRIGDSVPIVVGDDLIAPERGYALLARSAVDRVTAGEGSKPSTIRIVVPDGWGTHRTVLVRGALEAVGLGDAPLVSAATAAAATWTADRTTSTDAAIAVYDLSATRFGITVLRVRDGRTRALAVDGIDAAARQNVGGGVVDDGILRHVVASTRELFVACDTAASESATALADLRRECVRAKEALATEPATAIAVRLPGSSVDLLLERSVLDRIAAPTVRATIDVVRRALRTAGVDAAELSAILLVGGSTRLTVVAPILGEEFGSAVVTGGESAAAPARGAALLAVPEIGRTAERMLDTKWTGEGVNGADRAQGHPSRVVRLRRRVVAGAAAVAAAMTAIVGVHSTSDDGSDTEPDASGTAG